MRKLCATVLIPLLTACATNKPNIVFILSDDQGYGDVSALNPAGRIATPNIDRLAREGMYFTDAHSASSVCSPTRYSLLTGRYAWRTRLQERVLAGFSPPLIEQDRLTVAELLQREGYRTGIVGKWHLGFDWPLKGGGTADDGDDYRGGYKGAWDVDYTGEIQNGPLDEGFDTFFGISAALNLPPYLYIRDRVPVEPATVEKRMPHKGPAAASFEAIDVLPDLTREAIRYIDSQAAAAREGHPFFLYFPLTAPHIPIVPAAAWQGKSGINSYADFVMQLDWTVGQVLDALDDNGLADNTLVIFTSDNGTPPRANIPELQAAGHEPGYIYRGHKADIFEGGHRVPFLVRWPGKVKPGSVSDQLIGQIDFMATCADILDIDLPPDAAEDSVSFLQALLGKDTGPLRKSLVNHSSNGCFAIREGNWKLALCSGSGGWGDPGPGAANRTGMPAFQLYDLDRDPGETTNLAEKYPEKAASMKLLLAGLIARGRSTPGPEQANDIGIVMVKEASAPARSPGLDNKAPP
jgi:arylsulfatase A-like enzyme